MKIEVFYQEDDGRGILLCCAVPGGSTVEHALRHLGMDIHEEKLVGHVGIFGKHVQLSTVLCPGDRVEIYQPLRIDPKVARRKRQTDQAKRK